VVAKNWTFRGRSFLYLPPESETPFGSYRSHYSRV
jgi:hypothetical protein